MQHAVLVRAERPGIAGITTLARLRWVAVGGLLAFLAAFGWALPPSSLAVLVVVGALVVASSVALGRVPGDRPPAQALLASVFLSDVALLTAALAVVGGPMNPFSVLYLVIVTLAAVAASVRVTAAVTVAALAGYAALFAWHVALPVELGGTMGGHAHHGGGSFSFHLQGMWVALAVAAGVIAVAVSRLAEALRDERERRARTAHLASLTTLAAGAAHELGTPLGTIKVTATELERQLARVELPAGIRDDLALIREEVARSRDVLDRLALRAGELRGEGPGAVVLGELLDAVAADDARVEVRCPDRDARVTAPRAAVELALRQLTRNALLAGPGPVRVTATPHAAGVVFEVDDDGPGMGADVLARAAEPFFSTREPGRGTGLGLYLAAGLVEQLGGQLELASAPGAGTRARLRLPSAAGGAP